MQLKTKKELNYCAANRHSTLDFIHSAIHFLVQFKLKKSILFYSAELSAMDEARVSFIANSCAVLVEHSGTHVKRAQQKSPVIPKRDLLTDTRLSLSSTGPGRRAPGEGVALHAGQK